MRDPNMQNMAHKLYEPGSINAAQMQESLADASMGILQCYHKTARFRKVDLLATNWNRQNQYGAEQSDIIKIYFEGKSGLPYEMIVALMRKENSIRAAVIDENTMIMNRYNKDCALERWATGNSPETPNRDSQSLKHGWIGIAMQDITPELIESLKLTTENGALVADVLRNGPADIAGLRVGDVLVQIDDKRISNAKNVSNLIATFSPNQKTTFKVLRAEETIDIEMLIGEKPSQ